MKTVARALLFGLLVCLPSGARADEGNSAKLQVFVYDVPPFAYLQEGAPKGIVPSLISELLRRTPTRSDLSFIQWDRAYAQAREKNNTCIPAIRSAEREALFQWVGPILIDRWVLVSTKDKPKIEAIEDAMPYRIGVLRDDAKAVELKKRGFTIDVAEEDRLNFDRLIDGKIDYWATSDVSARLFIKRPDAGRMVISFWQAINVFLACNKQVKPEVIVNLRGAWNSMLEDGTTKRIIATTR
jgi:polar amino acid transport system substrate-binding protein